MLGVGGEKQVTLVPRCRRLLGPRKGAAWAEGTSTALRRKGAWRAPGIKKDGSPECPESNQETTYHGQYSENFLRCL